MADNTGDTRPRARLEFAKAKPRRERWSELLDEAFSLCLPRHEADNTAGDRAGSKEIYYSGGIRALLEKATRLHGNLFPIGQRWLEFSLTGSDEIDPERKEIKDYLEEAGHRFHSAIENSNFHTEILPALSDCLISTGAIAVKSSNTLQAPLLFEAVPIHKFTPIEGDSQTLDGVFREWKLPFEAALRKWPGLKSPSDHDTESNNKEIELLEAVLPEYETKTWTYQVLFNDEILLNQPYRTLPIIAFRLNKASGEYMGRGPVLDALPDIQSANELMNLTLRHGALSILGVWKVSSNSGIGVKDLKIKPGGVFTYKENSGGIDRMDPPGNTYLGIELIKHLDEKIREHILGKDLPSPTAGRKTAYEISTREAQRQALELPSSLRLLNELVIPLSNRILDVLTSPSMRGSRYYIDPPPSGLALTPTSPLVRLQEIATAKTGYDALAAVAQIDPMAVRLTVNMPRAITGFLRKTGFPSEWLNSEQETDQMMQTMRQEQQAVQAAEQGQAQGQAQGGGGQLPNG